MPSIRKIADRAGVSTSTVSRILNGCHGGNAAFSQVTRGRILEVCKQLNYAPNIHAKRLFSKRSNVIAVVVPPRSDHLPQRRNVPAINFSKVLSGIEDVFEARNQDLLLLSATQDFVESAKYLKLFRSRSIDGMLIWGAGLSEHYPTELLRQGWPFILVDSHLQDLSIPHVTGDNYGASAAIARHLLDLGHRRIAYIAGPEFVSTAVERRAGFEAQCALAAVHPRIWQGTFNYEEGHEIGRRILAEDNRPTAVAAINDTVALGVLQAARDRGLRVPVDLSVTGADGAYPEFQPKLTTFEAPMYEMGREAAELLLQRIHQKPEADTEPLTSLDLRLKTQLVVGDTTGPARE
ncbi:MAG: LacI family DNA-binding transcriptional regulator [Phycisphaerales bacterium]